MLTKRKKTGLLAILLILMLFVAGCSSNTSEEILDLENKVELLNNQVLNLKEELNKNNEMLNEKEKEIANCNQVLDNVSFYSKDELMSNIVVDEKMTINLVSEAFQRFWRVAFADYNPNTESAFIENGMSFRFYNEDIDTKEEMTIYLNEVFTESMTTGLTRSIFNHEKNNKLYHQDGDMGTLMSWNKADIILIDRSKDDKRRLYIFKVPTTDEHFDFEKVELVNVENQGWRVNSYLKY